MAQPRTLPFGKFKIQLGNGATPTEVFTAPCGFTDKSLKLSASTGSTEVPDCDDDDAAVWDIKQTKALSGQVTGQGVLAMSALAEWRTWFLSGQERNILVVFEDLPASGGGFIKGPAILTSFEVSASRGEKVKVSVTIDNAGAWGWTAFLS